MRIGEAVEVELSPHGSPARFTWRGTQYLVTTAPEPWFARERWWTTATGAARGSDVRFEREMWRVDAVPLQDAPARLDGSFDLARLADGSWLLDEAWDDDLEVRLFA